MSLSLTDIEDAGVDDLAVKEIQKHGDDYSKRELYPYYLALSQIGMFALVCLFAQLKFSQMSSGSMANS